MGQTPFLKSRTPADDNTSTKVQDYNELLGEFDASINGFLEIPIDGTGSITLTRYQATHGTLKLTGTLTGNRDVLLPTVSTPKTFTADASTDVITSASHGYSNDTVVTVSSTTTLPAPLVAGVRYYVRDVTTNTFKLAATLGGSAINITSAGSGTHSVTTLAGCVNDFTAWNATSGAFTVTIKTNADGSTGKTLTQGKARKLFHNGANVYAAGPEETP